MLRVIQKVCTLGGGGQLKNEEERTGEGVSSQVRTYAKQKIIKAFFTLIATASNIFPFFVLIAPICNQSLQKGTYNEQGEGE